MNLTATSAANAGTAGGTNYYLNLGGMKVLWGYAGTAYSIAGGGGSANQSVTLPGSFFSTVQYASCDLVELSVDARQSCFLASAPTTTTLSMTAANDSATTGVGGKFTWLVFGT